MKKLLLLLLLIPNLVMAERKDCKFDCSNCKNYEERNILDSISMICGAVTLLLGQLHSL